MYQSPLIQDLHDRGLIAQITDAEALDQLLSKESVTLYCGFDPTADSLHLGHLVPVLILKRFQEAGHKPIALVGGATGMIGDPSFKATERKLNTPDVIATWVDKIRGQVTPFLKFDGANAALVANNHDWFGSMNCLEFLRDIGKHFSVNAMIKKESVQQRLVREDQGISYTEFSYSLLQGYDFAELNKRHGCVLQIGGSDQWGNIVAGTDLTRRLNHQHVFGLTLPLITKADGTKFGKTESGAIWLDPKKTSPYAFYQFWLNTSDADVYKFLRLLHLSVGRPHRRDRGRRPGQRPEAGSPTHPRRGSHPSRSWRRRAQGRQAHFRQLVLWRPRRPHRERPRTTGPGRHARRHAGSHQRQPDRCPGSRRPRQIQVGSPQLHSERQRGDQRRQGRCARPPDRRGRTPLRQLHHPAPRQEELRSGPLAVSHSRCAS